MQLYLIWDVCNLLKYWSQPGHFILFAKQKLFRARKNGTIKYRIYHLKQAPYNYWFNNVHLNTAIINSIIYTKSMFYGKINCFFIACIHRIICTTIRCVYMRNKLTMWLYDMHDYNYNWFYDHITCITIIIIDYIIIAHAWL